MKKLTNFFRKNVALSLILGAVVGAIFRFLFGVTKELMWSWNVIPIVDFFKPSGLSQLFIFTIFFNALVDISSSILASIICGALLVWALLERALFYGLCSAAVFLALSSKLWHFMDAPSPELRISIVLGRVLPVFVLMTAIYLLQKLRRRLEATQL